MKTLKIDQSQFELIYDLSDDEITGYLDTETGDTWLMESSLMRELEEELLYSENPLETVLATLLERPRLTDMMREDIKQAAQIVSDTSNRYQEIPKQDSSDGYEDMEAYIESLEDNHLRELLEVAIRGKGAFSRFKDVLLDYPTARENWFKFRDLRVQQRMLEWFYSIDIEPDFNIKP